MEKNVQLWYEWLEKEEELKDYIAHAVQKLYPLEMISETKQATVNTDNHPNSNIDDDEEDIHGESQPCQENEPDSRRPKRAAATEARDRLLAQALTDSTE